MTSLWRNSMRPDLVRPCMTTSELMLSYQWEAQQLMQFCTFETHSSCAFQHALRTLWGVHLWIRDELQGGPSAI